MKRTLFLLLILFITSIAAIGQERKVTGTLKDKDTGNPMTQTTIQLLKLDSTFVHGTLSNEQGKFILTAPKNGKYILKISSVGHIVLFKNFHLSQDKNLDLGIINMQTDAVLLKGATITGQAMKVVVKEDTFIYNASAYRTPDGAVAEELVKRIPGAQVDDDGKITINGKEVKKILVDGKEFMTGDTKTAMKNLPTCVIEQIRTFDEKSDLSKVTGIDDGNEQTVLDFGLKKGANKGWMSNVDLALGTKNRYAERLMAAYFKDNLRIMGFGNANNSNDMGFGGRGGGFGRNRNGLNARKMTGFNINYEEKDKLKLNGSIRWNHSDDDVATRTSIENFVSKTGAFSNNINQSYNRRNSWNANMRLEWMPDTMTNIMFRPRLSYTENDGRSWRNSASFQDDPYLYVTDPLALESLDALAEKNLVVNKRRLQAVNYGKNKQLGGALQINRKFGQKGRNATLRADAYYTENDNTNLSTNNVHLYKIKDALGNDSTYQTNRYNLTPTKNWNYSLQATYSEPLWKATFLQLSYKFNYSYYKSDRSTYDFSNLGESFFQDITPTYRNWDSYLSRLEKPYESYENRELSRFSEYQNYTHDLELMFRMIREKYHFNIGMMLQPQKSHFIQHYQSINADTTRTVNNLTPTLGFRYQFSKVSNLKVDYRGYTSQPALTDMLDITDDSDPLNITKGNPGLKPSFTNNLRATYNNYIKKYQQSVMTFLHYQTTSNSISSKVTYDETTGGRTVRPENINGNWNINGGLMYNRSIDTTGIWNVNTWTQVRYNNQVGYLSLNNKADSEKNTTRTLGLTERLAMSFRNDWLEVELDGMVNYDHTRNQLQSRNNLDTWRYSYGLNVNITTPWGTNLSTDIHQNSRRGYNDQSLNTNELVWNAQISHSFLKKRNLILSLQFYDMLNNQSNFTRSVDAIRRSDTEYNSINSYAMLHVIYRLNLFGGKQARQEMNRNQPRHGGLQHGRGSWTDQRRGHWNGGRY